MLGSASVRVHRGGELGHQVRADHRRVRVVQVARATGPTGASAAPEPVSWWRSSSAPRGGSRVARRGDLGQRAAPERRLDQVAVDADPLGLGAGRDAARGRGPGASFTTVRGTRSASPATKSHGGE